MSGRIVITLWPDGRIENRHEYDNVEDADELLGFALFMGQSFAALDTGMRIWRDMETPEVVRGFTWRARGIAEKP